MYCVFVHQVCCALLTHVAQQRTQTNGTKSSSADSPSFSSFLPPMLVKNKIVSLSFSMKRSTSLQMIMANTERKVRHKGTSSIEHD